VSAVGRVKDMNQPRSSIMPVARRSPIVVQREFLDDAKLGLELTFQNGFTQNNVTNKGFEGITSEVGKKSWDQVQDTWEESIGGFGPNSEPVVVDKSRKNKLWGNLPELPSHRFVYGPNVEDGGLAAEWWFQLSLDPGVLEIQTMPAPAESFNPANATPLHAIVQEHIYDLATQQGFVPGGGGGHINVDFKTGFNNDYSLIPRILQATEAVIEGLRKKGDDHEEKTLVDFSNEGDDPFLSSERYDLPLQGSGTQTWAGHNDRGKGEQGKSRLQSWQGNVMDTNLTAKKWPHFREEHAKWLHKRPTKTQYDKAGSKEGKFGDQLTEKAVGEVLHYQAINIDHIAEELAEERRLEFRFFRGQNNPQEIYNGAKLIERITKIAREIR
jgi:hypothetical protein